MGNNSVRHTTVKAKTSDLSPLPPDKKCASLYSAGSLCDKAWNMVPVLKYNDVCCHGFLHVHAAHATALQHYHGKLFGRS